MKIAFVTDTHFGYRRFERDAYEQGREAILSAAREADVIILGGDNFDIPLPRMETLAEVTGILREAIAIYRERGVKGTPIFAIHGNHDRRAKGYVHPTELLAKSGLCTIVHNRTEVYEENGERIAVSGVGSLPDDLAREGLKKIECRPVKGAFNVFVLHQTFQEFGYPGNEDYLTFDDLPDGHDLYLCGHVHKPSLTGKVLNPGSTVVTQLAKGETFARGWLLYDTGKKTHEFRPVKSREFFFSELEFSSAKPDEIKEKVEAEAKRLMAGKAVGDRQPIIRIVVKGTLADGFASSDLRLPHLGQDVYVDNMMNSESLRERIGQIKLAREKKLSARSQGMEILRKKLEGTPYSLGDPEEVFESLLEGKFLEETVRSIEEKAAKGKS